MLENIYFLSSRCFVNFWGIFIRWKALRTAIVFFSLEIFFNGRNNNFPCCSFLSTSY